MCSFSLVWFGNLEDAIGTVSISKYACKEDVIADDAFNLNGGPVHRESEIPGQEYLIVVLNAFTLELDLEFLSWALGEEKIRDSLVLDRHRLLYRIKCFSITYIEFIHLDLVEL